MLNPKNYITVVLLVIGLNSTLVNAQSTSMRYGRNLLLDSTLLAKRKINIIKANTLSYLIWDYNISYERLSHTARRSFVVKIDYNYFSSTELILHGFTLRPGFRYYLTKKRHPPAGYYVQPFFIYGEHTIRDLKTSAGVHVSQIGGGLVGGLQWAIGTRFTIEIFIGCGYVNITASNTYRVRGVIDSIQPMLGASTGFRF